VFEIREVLRLWLRVGLAHDYRKNRRRIRAVGCQPLSSAGQRPTLPTIP